LLLERDGGEKKEEGQEEKREEGVPAGESSHPTTGRMMPTRLKG
jgi:hypothetical protein